MTNIYSALFAEIFVQSDLWKSSVLLELEDSKSSLKRLFTDSELKKDATHAPDVDLDVINRVIRDDKLGRKVSVCTFDAGCTKGGT